MDCLSFLTVSCWCSCLRPCQSHRTNPATVINPKRNLPAVKASHKQLNQKMINCFIVSEKALGQNEVPDNYKLTRKLEGNDLTRSSLDGCVWARPYEN